LERACVPGVSRGAFVRSAAGGLRQLRAALEFVRQALRGAERTRSAQTITEIVSAVIPCLDEEDAIGTVVSAVLAQRVAEVIVARRSGNGLSDRGSQTKKNTRR
jgi:hypothetical protein